LTICAAASFASFFLQRCGDPPRLHSFPTRRSSDLASISDASRARRDCARRNPKQENKSLCLARPARGHFKRLGEIDGNSPGYGQDRKSTRLNSSHLVISYAVFCLKKKKKYMSR